MFRVGDTVFHRGTQAKIIRIQEKTGDLMLRDKTGETWYAIQWLVDPVKISHAGKEKSRKKK